MSLRNCVLSIFLHVSTRPPLPRFGFGSTLTRSLKSPDDSSVSTPVGGMPNFILFLAVRQVRLLNPISGFLLAIKHTTSCPSCPSLALGKYSWLQCACTYNWHIACSSRNTYPSAALRIHLSTVERQRFTMRNPPWSSYSIRCSLTASWSSGRRVLRSPVTGSHSQPSRIHIHRKYARSSLS